MKFDCSSGMRWTTGIQTEHEVDLELDVEFSEILRSNVNIEMRFQTLETNIRSEIFALCAEQIVPQIIQDTHVDSHTEGGLHVDTHSKFQSQAQVFIPTRNDTSLKIRDTMRLRMKLATDRPVNAIQALSATSGGLAADITNEIMKLLKNAVLNIHDTSIESSWSLSENRATSLTVKIKKSSSDSN